MSLNIQLDHFNGPLDLLLDLITKQELDILDIPISEITDQYNKIINSWTFNDLDEAYEYLEMASRLILLKSKMMLPKSSVVIEVETDSKELLQKQLIQYKIFKELSQSLEDQISDNLYSYSKDPEYFNDDSIEEPKNINLKTLERNIRRILNSYQAKNINPVVIKPEKISVDTTKKIILEMLTIREDITLEELFDNSNDIEVLITYFLGILELYKVNKIIIEQNGSEIRIKKRITKEN